MSNTLDNCVVNNKYLFRNLLVGLIRQLRRHFVICWDTFGMKIIIITRFYSATDCSCIVLLEMLLFIFTVNTSQLLLET